MVHARIAGIGSYVPEKILANADLEQMVDTNDEWIVQRTGIRERRIAAEHEFTSDLCVRAALDLMERYRIRLDDVDHIIACTNTPDYPFPSAASQIGSKLGIPAAGAVDVNATCAGFVHGIQLASALISSGMYRKILVFGSDTMSKITDYTDRSTCILFGDGAGVILLEAGGEQELLLAHSSHSDGTGGIHVYRSGLSGSMDGKELQGNGCIVQNGREVYRWAVTEVPKAMARLAAAAGLNLAEIDRFVPHSANLRIIESICEKSGFPLERTLYSLVRYGNTSAASIPLSLDLAVKENRLTEGQTVLLYGFGAGLVQAGALLRWSLPEARSEA
ncbi:ketoacyl-ACP synthase III [Gorillibacterium sp. sgz5001074]|uniref:ketoacyl-ACP synthase III n=1 Tax=Gorillibacterium sp. sgz5001074 TaxID=3446695 RepID=UPI003F67EEDC